jgi:thiol-disulfide isomerase/thioredoxin
MKNRLFYAIVFLFSLSSVAQTAKKPVANIDERNISITYTPYKNTWIYLGSYYGKGKVLSDSAWLNEKGQGTFKGKEKLTGGIYFIVSPKYAIQFELLIGNEQHFSIVADSSRKDIVKITGSRDNDIFKEYTNTTIDKGKKIDSLSQRLSLSKSKEDSALLKEKISQQKKELQVYQEEIAKKYPKSLLAALLTAMKRPEVPTIPVINGKADSAYPFRFVKEHFWDDVNFNDDRLLHTPFFDPKLDEYFKYYVAPESDSIIPELKYMMLYARTGKEMYPYLLMKFTNKYINPEYMGQDKVFIYLFENFYAKGDTSFLNPQSRKTIFDRAYSLMANQLGNPAPVLNLTDTAGNKVLMQSIPGKFTLVAFWDPTCGHCKEDVPRLDSFYRAKWKNLNVKIYSVNVNDNTIPDFKKFIVEKNLSSDWVNVYQPKAEKEADAAAGKANFRQLYDVFKTPTYYLLDEQKNIIAKQLSLNQFDDLITAKLKQLNSKK